MNTQCLHTISLLFVAICVAAMGHGTVWSAPPNAVLATVFPAGGTAGETVAVSVSGSNLDGLKDLRASLPGMIFQQDVKQEQQFTITIPREMPTGLYDLRAVCRNGLSSSRPFLVSNRAELLEIEPNDSSDMAHTVPLDVVINGRMEKGGDQDHFVFEAKRDQRVVIECWAERIDSSLRAVLEVFDAKGRRLKVNRGFFGIDPLIDLRVPADGIYVARVHDLTYSGSDEHLYRLDIGTGPRVAFANPCVVQRGHSSRITLYGWNLSAASSAVETNAESESVIGAEGSFNGSRLLEFDQVDVEIPDTMAKAVWPLPVRLRPHQIVLDGFAYHFPGSHAPVVIGVTDVPVCSDGSNNHSPESAKQIDYPCEVSGQLIVGDEQDWFAVEARSGEVLFIEAFGQRAGSPVDLDISILGAADQRQLVQLSDEVQSIGGEVLPSSHVDPAGRWVVPADGRYLIVVRNVIGGLQPDPRRVYRLSVRREEPDFHLAVVSRSNDPSGLNVCRGGRAVLDVMAFRRRGMNESIRISAKNLPPGIECPPIWLGPGVDRATMVVSADPSAPEFTGDLMLEGFAEFSGHRPARGGAVVRAGVAGGWGRLTAEIPLAVATEAPLRITADGHETRDHHLYGELNVRHSPGGILDVAVYVHRGESDHQAPVKLIGVGLPGLITNQTATIPAGQRKGYISFFLPPTLPVGRYSIVIQAQTTVPTADKKNTESVVVYSDPVTFNVQPSAFQVEVDPFAPQRIRRGEVVKVSYSVRRQNGFISKIHTELATPGCVTEITGLRGRGVTFTSQTETGTIQIIANSDAPLGQLPFLRLYAVGVLEDEPVFHGSRFLNLEVVE